MANRYQPISHSMYIDLGGPMKFGLLGRTLGHSFSPRIHSALGNTNYELFEREPSQLQEFFADPELQGINITIPYKVNALEACDVVDPRAERIGCVNTMVRKDGKWHGYNTDYDGFVFTLQHAGIDVSGKECIILGDGASSATVHVALEDLGAKNIVHLSRKTAPFYGDAPNYYETAQIIINCTPIGMYPHNPANLIDITQFSKLEGVELRSFDNTARAAQLVAASDDPGVAAIAAPQCADLYNLSPLMRNIQNSDNNYTRFICISKDFHVYPGANKISVVTTASHAPGGLGTLLTKFANIGVNLTKLESRPIVGHNFEFLFYLDLEASLADPKVLSVLAELHTSQDKFRLLGNYPEN